MYCKGASEKKEVKMLPESKKMGVMAVGFCNVGLVGVCVEKGT